MKLNSNDVISRQTQTSGRTLLVVASSVIVVELHGLDPNNWKLLNGDVTAAVYHDAVSLLIAFLGCSLLVHWIADHRAYTKWFKTNEISIGSLYGNSLPKSTEPIVPGLRRRLQLLPSEFERLDSAVSKMKEFDESKVRRRDAEADHPRLIAEVEEKIANVQGDVSKALRSLKSLEEILEELPGNFRSVDRMAKFVIYIWYLAFPVVAGVYAMLLLWSPI